jgi:DNA-binding winged helix-turn-helix (wHTH) protein/tetratricopeptide (TPR) repeat protein
MDRCKPTRLRFGPFEADLEALELFDSGEQVHLQSKPFQFLATLIQHPGEVVTREQMSHVLWPDIYVQVNQGLNAAARKVRIALSDQVDRPKYFETLGSQGYRFIHDIDVLSWSSGDTNSTDTPIRIAVLPFQTEGSEQFYGSGLAAELTGLLGRVHPRLKTVAPGSTFRFRKGADDLKTIAEKLSAQYLVSGSFQLHRNRLSISTKLLAVEEGRLVWEWSTERNADAIFNALSEIAEQIVRALPEGILPQGVIPPLCKSTQFSNYLGFLTAQNAWYDRSYTRAAEALASFQKVASRDPGFAPAHAGIANAHVLLAKHELVPPRPAYQAAIKASAAALDLSPELPEALVPMAWARLSLEHDWVSATRIYERVLQSNPSYAFGYIGYGTLLLARGRVDDAVAAMEQAHQLDPLSPFASTSLSSAYYYARRYDDAIRQARYALELDEKWCCAHALVGVSCLAQRRYSDALTHFELATECSNNDPVMEAQLAHAYAHFGKISSAEPILSRLENREGHGPQPAFHIALIRLVLGDVNGAVRWLERACQDRVERTLFIGIDPRLDILRGTKHFEEMCKQVREPDPRRVAQDPIASRGGAA